MEKLNLKTPNFTNENIGKIAELFPNCVTEKKSESGELERSIDFDALRQELSNSIVEGSQERYSLNWPGKREALVTANTPISKTLRPCRDESVDFDNTKNIFIEGDNLDALKLLQETYLNKIKMIYIDPPYNTGKDFIYNDNFTAVKEEYDEASGQRDEEGGRLVANPDSNGRYHSDWLSMMYPRLKLARNLLCDEGVIFISIDDNEQANLKRLCDEVFGESNFLVNFSWRTDGNFDNQAKFKKCHEYILAYAKNELAFISPPVIDPNVPKSSKLYNAEVRNTIVKNGPKNPLGKLTLPTGFPSDIPSGVISQRADSWPHYFGDALIEDNSLVSEVEVESGWSSKDLLLSFILNNCEPVEDNKGKKSRFVIAKSGAIEVIKERGEEQSHVISSLQNLGGPQRAVAEIRSMDVIFDDYPKPVALIKYLCEMIGSRDHIVLDFFSGSATTCHAVMKLNSEDGGERQCVSIQLPEQLNEKSEEFEAGYKNIAEISKERIRRAGKKIKEDNADKEGIENLDTGFRVFKIDTTNMVDVHVSPDEATLDMFDAHVGNIKKDRSSEDLLFQVLLDWGVDLSLPIIRKEIAGKEVFFVDGNALVACFDDGICEAFVTELATRKPLRVVFRDDGFGSGKDGDSVKINVEQVFKLKSPATDIKVI